VSPLLEALASILVDEGYQMSTEALLILLSPYQCAGFLLRPARPLLAFWWWFLVPNEASQFPTALWRALLLQQLHPLCPLPVLLVASCSSTSSILAKLQSHALHRYVVGFRWMVVVQLHLPVMRDAGSLFLVTS
jgi:hypothetical protein